MTTILAGVDDEPAARDAAVLARALADATSAELVLAAVEVEPLVPLPAALRAPEPARRRLEELLAAVCADCAPAAATRTLAGRSAARALRALIEAEPPRAVVLGSSRRAAAGQAFAGRTVRQVLHEAPCAVAVAARGIAGAAPEGAAAGGAAAGGAAAGGAAVPGADAGGFALRRIVAGVDGSPESQAALAAAAELARAAGAQLHLVAVADEMLGTSRSPLGTVAELAEWDELVAHRRSHAEHVLTAALAEVKDAHPDGEVLVGEPFEQLAGAAAGADLLVVGSRHWGALSRVVVGSTAEELLRGTPCSLLLVPRPAEEADAG